MNDYKQLIMKIQNGKSTTTDERLLLAEFIRRYRRHKIENYLYSAEEMKQEFLLASWNAVFRAKLDIGDPVAFCVRRGHGAILDYYRRVGSARLVWICDRCCVHLTYDFRVKACRQCGCNVLVSREKEELSPNLGGSVPDKSPNPEELYELKQIWVDIRNYIQQSNLTHEYKQLALEALDSRETWYAYAKRIGRKTNWSRKFARKLQAAIAPLNDYVLV